MKWKDSRTWLLRASESLARMGRDWEHLLGKAWTRLFWVAYGNNLPPKPSTTELRNRNGRRLGDVSDDVIWWYPHSVVTVVVFACLFVIYFVVRSGKLERSFFYTFHESRLPALLWRHGHSDVSRTLGWLLNQLLINFIFFRPVLAVFEC